MTKILTPAFLVALVGAPSVASAAEISTHVLDLARGVGGEGVPVVLMKKGADGQFVEVARRTTEANGRVGSFGDPASFGPGDYRLEFDMTAYPAADAKPFFPTITLTFRVTDADGHYHVPVVVSPYGYSTYRGN